MVRSAAVAALALALAACPGSGQPPVQEQNAPLTFMKQQVVEIASDHSIHLDDGLVIKGDERLVDAIKSDGIANIMVLERFPPVFVVTFPDGAVTRYHSERVKP